MRFSLRTWILMGAAVLLIGGGIWYSVQKSNGAETVRVERQDVIEEVAVTGALKAPATIDLEFLASGRVVSRPVTAGARVTRGQFLMALDSAASTFQVQKARADLEAAKARLLQLQLGATPQTLLELRNNVSAAYRGALSSLDGAITKAENSRTILRADVYLETNKVRTEFNLPLDSTTARAEGDKAAADEHLLKLRAQRDAVGSDLVNTGALNLLFSSAPAELDYMRKSLVSSADILRRVVSSSISQATISTYLTDIASAQAGFDTSLKSFLDAVSAVQSAKDALSVKQEPPREADIKELEAEVHAAEASLSLLEKEQSDRFLVAPVAGVVTDVKYEVGEIARTNSVAVSMIATGAMEIEANIPEIDIAKVAVGQSASVTIDALPGERFQGSVIHIDPVETVLDGVTNFKVRTALVSDDARLKSGLTANLVIETGRKQNVLVIPFSSIIERSGTAFVKMKSGKKTEEVPVTLGIRGTDGRTEVIEGLSEGDEILLAPES